ncbi:glycine reductase [Desulfovibrio sp. PG-178-WT-4]|uniref:Glycine reductase n=1 Tax=Desulfovibrio porci TaxID=2605782 RepID=A0A6L5XH90_9BACT|nr:glycine/sarcosine/betaine reductase component B subunit [Desulfovibrio porci]MSS26526.1 glycine reductase [Desulfovibrio porci]
MRLELARIKVEDVVSGAETTLTGRTLSIDREELLAAVDPEGFFAEKRVSLVRPGQSARIIGIMDAMQPRCKIGGGTSPYPGAIGEMHMAGQGRTHVLDGVCVMQTGKRQGIQEGIVDMSGPGAAYSLFSRQCNVVLECLPPPDVSNAVFDEVTRRALARAALYLGEAARDAVPDEVDVFDADRPVDPALPKVAYIYYLQSQGPLRNTYVYGLEARNLLPTLLHPNEVLDGAIVSGNYIIACQKNPSFLHANNPVVRELYARHGVSCNFVGVIVANENSTLTDKKRSADFAAKLARQLGAQGVVMTQEGGGHADTDLMLAAKACKERGIVSVMLINELAGADGDQPSLVDTTPEAVAVVSTGNNDQVISLPAVDVLCGGASLTNVPDAAAAFSSALGRMYTATNQLGAYALQAKAR